MNTVLKFLLSCFLCFAIVTGVLPAEFLHAANEAVNLRQSKDVSVFWMFKPDPDDVGIQQQWHALSRPGPAWTKIKTGLPWEKQGFGEYDGIGWYWNVISVPKSWERIWLFLPAVDDAYTLYVNGIEVCKDGHPGRKVYDWAGSHEITEAARKHIPAVVMLRVEDYGMDGGIVRSPVEVRNYPGQIEITDQWKFSTDPENLGIRQGWHTNEYSENDWKQVSCGASWEQNGYDFDGYGWYRKRVTLPGAWKDQRIFLELADVDDYFDVYMDGQFVVHWGHPRNPMWGKISRLEITRHVKPGREHLLCIRVQDIGGPGGIKGAPCLLSAQMPVYETDTPSDYDYLFAPRHPKAPVIGPYTCQTALENRRFQGITPVLRQGKDVTWHLVKGPPDLAVNPDTGQPVWANPVLGPKAVWANAFDWDWPVVMEAKNQHGHDYAVFLLKVLSSPGPLLGIIQTQYIDWVVPADIAVWMTSVKPHAVIDKQWELMRDVIGFEPNNGRQVVKYQYDIGTSGWSGNPVKVGPGFWSSDPVQGWGLGIWLHEVVHNFNGQTPIHEYSNNDFYGGIYHHFCEYTGQYVLYATRAYPDEFMLKGTARAGFQEFLNGHKKSSQDRYRPFGEWIRTHEDITQYDGDHYGIWMGIVAELIERYGYEFLETCIRAMRRDGLAPTFREQADSVEKMNALNICILSCATGEDLFEYFTKRKFGMDETFYRRIYPQVQTAVRNLPREDRRGWKCNPETGHYYRRTPFAMNWQEAEQFAQSVGGHLASVHNREELEWLASRFRQYPDLWIGFYRNQHEQWTALDDTMEAIPWDGGYPFASVDHQFAVFHVLEKTFSTETEGHRLLGIVEAESLPELDYPGFQVDYSQ